MSPRDSTERRGINVAKPKADIYTLLLGLSLLAIVLAILFLVLEMRAYEFEFRPAGFGAVETPASNAQFAELEPNVGTHLASSQWLAVSRRDACTAMVSTSLARLT